MRILHRYIYQEFFFPFLTGTLFFTMFFAIPKLKDLVGLMFEKGVSFLVVLELFLYLIPVTSSITIPMGTLFGTLFSLGRLSQDSEIVAMRANGISLFKIFKPVFMIGIMSALFLFFFMNYILTESSLRYNTIYTNIIYANPSIVMSPKRFSDFSGNKQKITALEIDRKGDMHSVYLYERGDEEMKMIYAQNGRWFNNEFNSKEKILKLYNGELIRFNLGNEDFLERINFDELVFNIINEGRGVDFIERGVREMSYGEVQNLIRYTQFRKQRVDPSIYVELQRKISLPLACIAFVIMAIPLAISFQRSGKGIGLGMSMVVILFYYMLLSTAEAIGKKEVVDPSLSIHLPNVIFAAVGLILFIIKTKK